MLYLMIVIGAVVTALLATATSLGKVRSFPVLVILDFVVTFAVLYAIGESSFTHATTKAVFWTSFGVALSMTVLLGLIRYLDRRGFAPEVFVNPREDRMGSESAP